MPLYFLAAVFLAAGFLAFLATGFLAAFFGDFLAATFFTDVFLTAAFLDADFFTAFASFFAGFLAATFLGFSASLKEPLAPAPFTCVRVPAATIFLMAPLQKVLQDFSSTLLLARMCFLMACREEPLRSLSSATAAVIIAVKAGWAGAFLGADFLAGAAADMAAERFVCLDLCTLTEDAKH